MRTKRKSTAATATTETAPIVPAWWTTVQRRYKSGDAHAFLLHWAVADYVTGSMTMIDWLATRLNKFAVVVRYCRATGITFPSADPVLAQQWRDRFVMATGLPAGGATGPDLSRFANPSAALPLLDKLIRFRPTNEQHPEEAGPWLVGVIIDHAHGIVPDASWGNMNGEDRASVDMIREWCSRDVGFTGALIVLLTRDLGIIHSDLRQSSAGLCTVEVPSPDEPSRLEAILRYQETYQDREGGGIHPNFAPADFARMSGGMLRVHLESVFLMARELGVPITREFVRDQKRTLIAQEFGETLETWEPNVPFCQIGGNAAVKKWLQNHVIAPLCSGKTDRVPKGVLLLGPPGTGKTLLARGIATESRLNCVKFDPSRIFDSLVGASERNLRRALGAIVSMAPVIVFVDELDQQGGSRGGDHDGGTSSRVFGMLLDFMADPQYRGKILWVAASNRPDLLDAAMKRPGRFDRKIPCLPPTAAERAEILGLISRNLGHSLAHSDCEALTRDLNHWTGAELEGLAQTAGYVYEDARDAEDPLVWFFAYERALECYRPTTGEIMHQSLLAIRECNDLTLLSPEWLKLLDQNADPEPETPRRSPFAKRGARDIGI